MKVFFAGIDDWNRPVFKVKGADIYVGCIEKLFDYGATEAEVLSKVTEADLEYFGREFDCEPHGGRLKDIEIVS